MNVPESFRSFVTARAEWFRGCHPETDESLAQAESILGLELPASLKWLLRDWGYWHATGIDSLDDSVTTTLEWRRAVGLPTRFVVLRDLHDAGVILLETSQERSGAREHVLWLRSEHVPLLATQTIEPEPGYSYPSFSDYVAAHFDSATEGIEPEDVHYEPSADRRS